MTQEHGEGFIGLRVSIAVDGDPNRSLRLAGREGDGGIDGTKVRGVNGTAGLSRRLYGHVLARRAGETDGELKEALAAVPFGLTATEMNAWIRWGGGQELWDELAGGFGIKCLMAGNTGVQMGGWFRKEFLVADIAGIVNSAQFRVRFLASDLGAGSVIEAGVDGVEVFTYSCDGTVLGDLDGDGIVGINDFLILVAGWGPCADPCPPFCLGDIDENCDVGINAFLLLLANWT